MKIDKSTLRKWKLKIESGEKTTIASKVTLSKNTVSRAFNGHASRETIEKINNYFKLKK